MRPDTFPARVLALAVYLMAAMLPVLAATGGLPLSDTQHAQMMASEGHVMRMETAKPGDAARMLLCQQQCAMVAATLPVQVPPAVESAVARSDVVPAPDRQVASLSIPPPGPPPKAAVI